MSMTLSNNIWRPNMSSITFGRYTPYNTFVHKLDARNKLFLTILLIVGVFFQYKVWSTTLLFTIVLLLLLNILMLISKVSFLELFKSLTAMWLLIIFMFAIYIFIPNPNYTGPIAFNIGFDVYWQAFYQAGYIILRLVLMIALMMILTSTTTPMNLTYAFEWYMAPLKLIKVPVHAIAMTMSIALRFIPTLLEESDRIMKAQASRGVDFNHGRLMKRFKAIISLIIPLFASAIDRSEELSNAMEVRGYDPNAKRTRYRVLRFSWRDIIAFIIAGSIFAGIIVFFIYDRNTENGINVLKVLFKWDIGF